MSEVTRGLERLGFERGESFDGYVVFRRPKAPGQTPRTVLYDRWHDDLAGCSMDSLITSTLPLSIRPERYEDYSVGPAVEE